ncbi:MAG: pentapeptide repeat-containing protein [Cyanobacterium sp.]
MTKVSDNNSLSELDNNAPLASINRKDNSVSVPPPIPPKRLTHIKKPKSSFSANIIIFLVLSFVGIYSHIPWLGAICAMVAFILALRQTTPFIREWIGFFLTPEERRALIGSVGLIISVLILAKYVGVYRRINIWLTQFKYDEFGSWAEWVGALGQISIAVLAVYVAWQQYVISKDLTIQQNRITQQQTIDTYFQGISDLVLGPDGLLEDWPQERAIAEGRTAAILTSVDPSGKAKILRFLSRSRLITPLRRDSHLGRVILDGSGGYAEDRQNGMKVINLGVVLAGNNLKGQDLRWTDLSDANMVKSDLSRCDLSKANLSRTVLVEATLEGADLKKAILFYGHYQTATPRDRTHEPNYETGEHTGAVIEKTDLTGVKNLSEENRYYCCCWGGEYTRSTIPGGCQGIPNKLENPEDN